MDKDDIIHIYNGILLNHEKNEIMQFGGAFFFSFNLFIYLFIF